MTESPSDRRLAPAGPLRSFLRAICIVLAVTFLTSGIFVFSRYASNRRLMKLIEPENRREVNIAIGWKGETFDWLQQWLDPSTQTALFCRPTYLLVQTDDPIVSNARLLEVLKATSGLEEIFIHNRDLPDGCLEVIAGQHRPRILQFRKSVLRPEDSRWLSKLTSLKHVNLGQFTRDPRTNDWAWLTALPNLEKLEVSLWAATDHDVLALAMCPGSTNLSLSGPDVSDEALSKLCNLTRLKFLDLNDGSFRLNFADGQKLPETLECLELHSATCDDESLEAIAGLNNLNRIWVHGGRISNTGMKVLARLPALRQLWLNDLKQVTDEGLKELVASKSLTEVHVSGCGTTPSGLIHLNTIPNWTDLRFESVQFRRMPGADRLSLTPENVGSEIEAQKERSRAELEVINGPPR
jgi:hypothetical protein